MRIMHIASKDLPVPAIRGGAVQLWIEKVAKELASQQSEVCVVSPWVPELSLQERADGVDHRRIRFSPAYVRFFRKWLGIDPFGYHRRIAMEAVSWRPDIIHIHGGGSSWLPYLQRYQPSTPVYIHLHNDPGLELHKWPGQDWHNVRFVACSRFIADASSKALGIPADRMQVVWNGVDVEDFIPWWQDSVARSATRSALGIPVDALVLLFCGRVAPEKGPDWLAEAALPLMRENPRVWCLFAGDYHPTPDTKGGEWYKLYAEIAGTLRLVWDRVRFTGPLPPTQMPEIFSAGDIFVGPAQNDEGFGMVYVEAMAAGLPVVACPRGGIPEFVDERVGRLVTDKVHLAVELKNLVDSTELRVVLGRAGRDRAVGNFSWSTVAANVLSVYQETLPVSLLEPVVG